jgi:hypothetical protein
VLLDLLSGVDEKFSEGPLQNLLADSPSALSTPIVGLSSAALSSYEPMLLLISLFMKSVLKNALRNAVAKSVLAIEAEDPTC